MKKLIIISIYVFLGFIIMSFSMFLPPTYSGYIGYCESAPLINLPWLLRMQTLAVYSLIFFILLVEVSKKTHLYFKFFKPISIALIINLIFIAYSITEFPIVEKLYGGYLQADTIIFGKHPYFNFSFIFSGILLGINFRHYKLKEKKSDLFYVINFLTPIILLIILISVGTPINPEPCRG
jgi:hypothetical protein